MLNEHHRVVSDMNAMIGSSFSGHSKKGSVIRELGANIGIGYDVLDNKNVSLYPLIGLGFEGFQARFYRDNSAVPFDNLLENPAAQSDLGPLEFTNIFFNYRAGFGVSFRSDKVPGGSIGLRAMYTGSFTSHSWKSKDGQSLMDVPEDRLSQFHIGLIMGRQMHRMMKH